LSTSFEYRNFRSIANGQGGATGGGLPIQPIPNKEKTLDWKKACMDYLEREGIRQKNKNTRFIEYRKMTRGHATYTSTGYNEDTDTDFFNTEAKGLARFGSIPSHIKHFDIIGIIVNALAGIFDELDDRYAVESLDEYATNDYLRNKTELTHKYIVETFKRGVDELLMQRGLDPNKADFKTEEEQQAYQEQIQTTTKELTPIEIEKFLSKDFKILAVEWAENTLVSDAKRFTLKEKDRDDFVSYLITGRFFRHYRVGYDSYTVETWLPEEVFFSQEVDAKYPQDGEFVGRQQRMSTSTILNRFGHLMTATEQEFVGNYWNKSKNWSEYGTNLSSTKSTSVEKALFSDPVIVPFHNYFDHKVNEGFEDALGIPMGNTISFNDLGEEVNTRSWTPRMDTTPTNTADFSSYQRDDIEPRLDTIMVTEAYFRSWKRIGFLIYTNEIAGVSLEVVTDDLMPEFIKENGIKKLKNISMQDLQKAVKTNNLDDYINTITYSYIPEIWGGIKIRGNGSTIKDDLYLNVAPLEYQIKGEYSNLFDLKMPVSGIMDDAITPIIAPYQQLHNICMNQNTEMLRNEILPFYAMDVTGLPAAYQNKTTEDALLDLKDTVRNTSILPLDLSKQNTEGNMPNVFQKQDISFTQNMQNRYQMAMQYREQAFAQLGITPQILGQSSTYITAEGVKQGATATSNIISHRFDKMNVAKAKGMDIQLAVAQYCEVNKKDASTLIRRSDGDHAFINIIAQDGDIFPLRQLGVVSLTNSKDRKIVESLTQFVLQDNTMKREYEDVIEILRNPVLAELSEVAKQMRIKADKKVAEQRRFEQQQQQEVLKHQAEESQKERDLIQLNKDKDRETNLEVAQISAYGRLGDKQVTDKDLYDRLDKTTQNAVNNNFKALDYNLKQREVDMKDSMNNTKNLTEKEKHQLKARELDIKEKELATKERIALENRNKYG
jgi:hypothetical protein